MSEYKYKHVNWYCQPHDEAEAREIIARLVSSGATIGSSIYGYRWNICDHLGVMGGVACTSPDIYTQIVERNFEYTIEQVREKFPLPHEVKQ